MEAKNTIRHPLTWKNARRFFYWRLRRRLSEELIVKRMVAAAPSPERQNGSGSLPTTSPPTTCLPHLTESPRAAHLRTLRSWTGLLDEELERDDRKVATWYEENKKNVQAKIDTLKTQNVSSEVAQLLIGNKEGGLKGVQQVLSMLPVEEKEAVLKYLGSG